MVRWGTPRDNRPIPMPEVVRIAANLALAPAGRAELAQLRTGFYMARWYAARGLRAIGRFLVGR